MKVTLFALNSSFTHTNLAVRYLASVLTADGIDCRIAEFNLKDKKKYILHDLVCSESDIYTFSVYIWNRNEMLTVADELKKLRPKCRIIFGGPEVSYENSEFFRAYPQVDTVIRGEGEAVISEICRNSEKYRYTCVDGLCNDAFINSGILYDKYPSKGDILYYESTRGCPFRCNYCLSSLSSAVRAKSSEQTLNDLYEFEKLPNKPRIIKFVDRTFNYDLERAKKIWRALGSDRFTMNYHFEIAADLLDAEAFEILSEIPKGKFQFEAGIQSTNMTTLKSVNRACSSEKAIKNLLLLKSFGNIHIHADLIAGLPYEDYESFKRSFDQTILCCHKLQLGFLKMLKGSRLRHLANEHGYIFETKPPYKVLANNYLSYNELYELERIADVIDRFYSKDNFKNTFEYILSICDSPFELFKELTNSLTDNAEKLSQHQCRLAMIELVRGDSIAMSALALDTLIWENKNPPAELQRYYRMLSNSNDIIYNIKENFKGYNDYNFNIYVGLSMIGNTNSKKI